MCKQKRLASIGAAQEAGQNFVTNGPMDGRMLRITYVPSKSFGCRGTKTQITPLCMLSIKMENELQFTYNVLSIQIISNYVFIGLIETSLPVMLIIDLFHSFT